MRASAFALVSVFAWSVAGCGPTLTRAPDGWREQWMTYSIAPLDNGDLLPSGWTLIGFTPKDNGFRRNALPEYGDLDFGARHAGDDAELDLSSVRMSDDDRAERGDALADAWLDRLVRRPQVGDAVVGRFVRAIPRLVQTGEIQGERAAHTITFLEGYDAQIEQRESFTVSGGEGVETVLSLGVRGSPIDRKLCLVVIKPAKGDKMVVAAYANHASAFDADLADARSFTRRVRF